MRTFSREESIFVRVDFLVRYNVTSRESPSKVATASGGQYIFHPWHS
jgi:hypothetical protein